MSTEIYLRIIKDMDPSDDPTGATLLAKLASPVPLPGVICGDSLDAPFIKWIKLTGFKNSIGFDSGTVRQIDDKGNLIEKSYGTSAGSYEDARRPAAKVEVGEVFTEHALDLAAGRRTETKTQAATGKTRYGGARSYSRRSKEDGQRWGEWEEAEAEKRRGSTWRPHWADFNKNDFLKVDLPDHSAISFTKRVDNSTPQLAYACSCQESIGTAVFLFRRRIGLGVRGIRVPFMAIILSKCLLKGWELNGEDEECTIGYQEIRWCTYDQLADFNAATGMSARQWDTASGAGGESAKMYIIMGGIAAAAMAAGVLDTALSSALFSGSSSDSTDDDITDIE